MDGRHATWRRAGAAMLMALGLATWSAQAAASEMPFVKARLVQVDVYDRFNGSALPVYGKDGRNYVVGVPGHEYAVRIRNCTNGRILVATSVDGVNVVSGETAAPSQTGYVLEPWGSVEIAGWRKSLDRIAAFYFTDLGDSYAARTGRPQNVGVIGVAVFQEKQQPIAWRDYGKRFGAAQPAERQSEADAPARSMARQEAASDELSRSLPAAAAAPAPRSDMAASDSRAAANELRSKDAGEYAQKSLGKIGTGHGRSEDSRVTTVAFERATDSPAETVAVQYDRRENLLAMGVLPRPWYAQRQQPDPFPAALRFAPDPR
jgi:hypothetical protein